MCQRQLLDDLGREGTRMRARRSRPRKDHVAHHLTHNAEEGPQVHRSFLCKVSYPHWATRAKAMQRIASFAMLMGRAQFVHNRMDPSILSNTASIHNAIHSATGARFVDHVRTDRDARGHVFRRVLRKTRRPQSPDRQNRSFHWMQALRACMVALRQEVRSSVGREHHGPTDIPTSRMAGSAEQGRLIDGSEPPPADFSG